MNRPVGTLAWARETGGELSKSESRKLLRELLRAQLTLIPDEWLHKLGVRRPHTSGVSIEDLMPPDSAAATLARQACRDVSPAYLYNHCARSYGWARILGARMGIEVDPELMYVSAMLHDLGITETHGGVEERPPCFALVGADAAARTLADSGWDDSRIECVCEAITLHLNLGVDLHYGPEAHLLNLATALDVTGLRKWTLTAEDVHMVLDQYPWLDQNTALPPCWLAEANRFPKTRAGWLERNIQFSRRVRKAQFP